MKKTAVAFGVLAMSLALVRAQVTKDFPSSWGKPPAIQTRDIVELPGGYGRGSSTLAKWINANLEKDKAGNAAPTSKAKALFENNFEQAEVGKLPDTMEFAVGEFTVKQEGTNKYLELPGAPLDSFSVQFGPVESANLSVSARILGTTKSRRMPTFGVGLNGVGGYKLQVSAGKKSLELLKDQEAKVSAPFEWKSGTWTELRLQVRKIKDGEWKVEGKAWPQDSPEPKEWMVSADEKEEPAAGKASVIASPFAGTPVWFDDLRVEKVDP
jgi:hypothetical protein